MPGRQAVALRIRTTGQAPCTGAAGARARRSLRADLAKDTSGKKYFLLLVDDATRFMWLVLLATKDEAAAAIKRVQALAESESGLKLRTDRSGEFTSGSFTGTAPSWASAVTSPPRTHRSRTVWWSAVTARWCAWPGVF